jgi:hypothetical protein
MAYFAGRICPDLPLVSVNRMGTNKVVSGVGKALVACPPHERGRA